jgi:hypothetical protein
VFNTQWEFWNRNSKYFEDYLEYVFEYEDVNNKLPFTLEGQWKFTMFYIT